MDIEKIATAAVSTSISTTEYLSSFINESDKEPSWDGRVYIYNDKSKKKSMIGGNVPVQVKGHVTKNLSKSLINYQVDMVDLNNYLNDGGVMFFVVYISPNGKTSKIYYSSLLPIKLRMIISKCNKSKSIELEEFPEDNVQKVNLFIGFFENSFKQRGFAKAELPSIDDYEKQGILESITLGAVGTKIDLSDPQRTLLYNETYLYANIKGSSIPQPLSGIPFNKKTLEDINRDITVSGRLFYKKYTLIRSKDSNTIMIGHNIQIVSSLDRLHQVKIHYKLTSCLYDGMQDLDFFITAVEAKKFEIGGNVYKFVPNKKEMDSFNIDRQRRDLAYGKKIIEVFKMLGFNKNVDISKFTNADWQNIDYLIKAFIDKRTVSGLKANLPPVFRMEITNAGKVLLVLKHCEEPSTYEISDFFKTKIMFYNDVEGKSYPIPQYAILRKEDFLGLSNLDLSVLLPSYQNADKNKTLYERANFTFLELLNAYDDDSNRIEILNLANEFAEWLCNDDYSKDFLPSEVSELNRLQAVKRKRVLSKSEMKYLYSLVEDQNQREDIKVGACLLLDDQSAAEIHFERIPKGEQSEFIKYPIFRFWKNKKTLEVFDVPEN